MRRGFTIVELIVSFGVIAILIGTGVSISQQAQRRQAVIQTAEGLSAAMKTARENALAGKKDTIACGAALLDGWRVVVLANGYRLEGVCGSAFFSKTKNYTGGIINSPTPTVLFKPLALGASPATIITVSGSGVSQAVQVTASGEVK